MATSVVDREEWDYYQAAMESENGMLAITLGGAGDVTATTCVWKYHEASRSCPRRCSTSDGSTWSTMRAGS